LNISNATKNLIERVNTLLTDVKKNGFRGVKVQRIEKESVWHPEYAIFVLEFNIPLVGFMSYQQSDCEYCHREWFDEEQLKDDFKAHVESQFPECEVNVSYQGREFEILGRNNKEFYNHYQDQLEEVYMQDDY